MVWAAVSYNHKTDLHIVQGNMTALKYRDTLLNQTVQPLLAQTGLTFQDYNARPHRARIVTDYVQKQGLQTCKLAGSFTHRAAMRRVREKNFRETTGASGTSGVAGNSSEN